MKGLSNNTKTIATLFLFVCLAANSQVFQSNLKSQTGSATLAQSINIEDSQILPTSVENCKEENVKGLETGQGDYETTESNMVYEENLR